ncbi:hypothetical protein CSV71_08035 [Sporosarcina sp. P21c]|uniref:hypothetical protein n=1 Tax=unclassified Sporosarcina TaxID=2647733 RepID=UPI000C17051A|nr:MULTISPECIES: hypothetical protein [unclassified Sporosarcina]PIC66753.1 hypothetical protein CSV78_11255 [Sporosarcina sp. P16a]PIC89888.1 hypothetical protein CSV71_08035 [Sporosarcina sp. P21c]PIC93274.1 hypothetical protein CSV70_06850 [Sporosarcina sp. P25]
MTYFIEVIENFQGIIGAIFGVVATLVTTNILNKSGTVKAYFYDVNKRFSKPSEWGEEEEPEWAKAEDCIIRFELLLHNTSSIIQPLKDVSISVGNKKCPNNIYWNAGVVKPSDHSPTFDAINIKPGEVRKFLLNVQFKNQQELHKEIFENKIFLEYTLPNKILRNKKNVKIKE